MFYFRTICFFALCVFCVPFLPATDMHSMQFYQAADKLPSMAVSAIAQDSSGAMYFGTRGSGLVKYDGNSYMPYLREPFSPDDSIPSVVQCMLMDDDVLFLGTYAGVFRFDTRTGSCRNYKICNDVVCCFLRDSQGRLWVGTLDGLALLNDVTGESIAFSNRDPIRTIGNNTVRGLYEDVSGRIFACTYDGIFQYDESGGSFVRPDFMRAANPAAHNVVYSLEEDAEGNFWASAWGTGLVKIDSVTGDFTVYPLPNNAIYCMSTRYVDGAVLAGTWGGGLHLLYPDTGTVSSYTTDLSTPYALPNDTVYSIYKDRLGLLWIGTNGGGIVTYDKNRSFLQPVRFDSPSVRNVRMSVQRITADKDGNLWIILKNKGILYYEPESGVLKEYSPENGNLKSGITYCVYIAPDGNMYLGNDCGLFLYDKKSDTFEAVPWYAPFLKKPESRMVYDIVQTSDGEFWIGTYGAGVVTYDPSDRKYRRYVSDDDDAQALSSNVIYFVAEDSRGIVWVGTNAGLNRYLAEKDAFQQYVYDVKNTAGIGGLQIISFYESQDGTRWFATNDSGVTAMNPETDTFVTYAHASGLPSNIVAGMVEIAPDMFWLATGNGLALFDRSTGSMQVYTTADGLPSNQFSAAPVVSSNGTVWFGTSGGLVFLPAKSNLLRSGRSGETGARSVLTGVTVNGVPLAGERYEPGAPVYECAPQERNITVSFASLDFSPLARPLFSYQLKGFSGEWVSTGNEKTVRYINLPPGSYTFRVKDSDPLYEIPDEGAAFSFVIKKPLYVRWYFILLYVAAGTIVLYAAVKIRDVILLKRKMLQLEALASSLQNSNLELQQLSCTDVLTGIANRRGFERLAPDLWKEAVAHGRLLSLIMVDIDYFKDFNDTYGHPEGDKVLKTVAKKITNVVDSGKSISCRYGGEEFLIMMFSADFNEILHAAERIRQSVEYLRIKGAHPGHELITVSVGLFVTNARAELDWETCVSYADLALYEAKKNGRNCVRLFTPSLLKS